jgi:hypothetical protein
MEQLIKNDAKIELEKKVDKLLTGITEFNTKKVFTLSDKVKILNDIRKHFYENLNQFQHENLLLKVCDYFEGENKENIRYEIDTWKWHPNQTSKKDEVDLMGFKNEKLVVCAEVTTANSPNGKIDTIMRNTLDGLNKLKTDKYYVVTTDEMYKRAKSKIKNRGLNIKLLKFE